MQTESTHEELAQSIAPAGSPTYHLVLQALAKAAATAAKPLQEENTRLEAIIEQQRLRLGALNEYYGEDSSSGALLKLARLEMDAERWRALTDNRWVLFEVTKEQMACDYSAATPSYRRMHKFVGYGISALPSKTFETMNDAVDAALGHQRKD